MTPTGMRIQNVRYDASGRRYHGAVTFYERNGIQVLQVSAPGMPTWGYERTLEALSEAGLRARAQRVSGRVSRGVSGHGA